MNYMGFSLLEWHVWDSEYMPTAYAYAHKDCAQQAE